MAEVILVVEEDASLRATLGAALSTEETTAVLATGAAAVEELQRGLAPDAIVIDLDMRDGFVVLVRLEREMETLVPVVALSSHPRRLLDAGVADAVVMKPFEVGHLLTCVHRACGEPRGAL
jgi:DNA-binding response OmpR family regulator